jgi:hypothetical protein
VVTSFETQEWPDPFDLLYQLTVSAETAEVNGQKISGLTFVRLADSLIRTVFRPRKPMYLWDSTANGGQGAFTTQYVNYAYAGYINRDSPSTELYNRVTNIRFEAFNYPVSDPTPAITQVPELTTEILANSVNVVVDQP